MGVKIHQLPPELANQIAAGEVIERPASVVKELLENTLDAGATEVLLEIGYGGLNQIKISDNGCGIHAEDLPLAVAAHATSKIFKLDDLYAINTMGFRGEALASIASIAKVTISSRPKTQNTAMMLQIKGAEYALSPCARNVGTSVDVVDLFFNAPVRKRFLKSEKLEFQAIEQVVKRFALSVPEMAITLKHNHQVIFSLPAAVNEKTRLTRITRIFGTGFMKDARVLHSEVGGMKLEGWVSGTIYQRSQSDKQWVYINQRMIKDKLINHAIKQAYEGLLHPGRFPAFLLYFSIQRDAVDVNVHPTKHEVRFQQPRLIHDFFISQLNRVLREDHLPEVPIPKQPDAKESCRSVGEPEMEFKYSVVKNTEQASTFYKDWISLNKEFGLAFVSQEWFLVHVNTLYSLWLNKQLEQQTFPLKSRPLLVPVVFPCSQSLQQGSAVWQPLLEQWGIQIEWDLSQNILVKSVPVMLPYLDLKAVFQWMEQTEHYALDALMNKAQSLDLAYLSFDERRALNQFLLEMVTIGVKPQGLYQRVSEALCRMLIDA